MFKMMMPLFAPEVALETPTPTGDLTISDMVDLMGEDDNKEEKPEVKEPKEDKPKEEKEPKEDEELEPEPKLELETEFPDLPKRQEILKEFPELFKKFPGLEKAYYREQQYSELFATPAEAKEASERLSDYNALETALLEKADLGSVLKTVKESDPEAFNKIAGNYLGELFKIDPPAYQNEIANVLKQGAVNMYLVGQQNNNDNLKAAAEIMHQFMFGTPKITGPNVRQRQNQNNQEDPEKKKFEEERNTFKQEKLNNAVDTVEGRVDSIIDRNIDKYLDPKSVMTDYVRDKAKGDIKAKVDETIDQDTRFKSILDRLWKNAEESGFSKSALSKIEEAYLNKTKSVLPDILKSVRSSALKGFGGKRQANNDREETPREERRERVSPKNDNQPPKRKLTTLEFLSQD